MDMQLFTALITITSFLALIIVLIKLRKIHELVNSRLSAALDEKERLETEVEDLGGAKAPAPRGPDDK